MTAGQLSNQDLIEMDYANLKAKAKILPGGKDIVVYDNPVSARNLCNRMSELVKTGRTSLYASRDFLNEHLTRQEKAESLYGKLKSLGDTKIDDQILGDLVGLDRTLKLVETYLRFPKDRVAQIMAMQPNPIRSEDRRVKERREYDELRDENRRVKERRAGDRRQF